MARAEHTSPTGNWELELDFWVGGHRLGLGWGCCCWCCYQRRTVSGSAFYEHNTYGGGNLGICECECECADPRRGTRFEGLLSFWGRVGARHTPSGWLAGWMLKDEKATQRVCNVPGRRRIWRSTQIQFARSPAKAQQYPKNRQLANLGSRAKHSSCRPGRNDSTRMAQDNRCILIICFGCNCLSCSAQWLYICGYSKNKKRPAEGQKSTGPQVHKSRSPAKRPHNSAKAQSSRPTVANTPKKTVRDLH